MSKSRFKGLQNTLLLGAVGDALGAPIEFMGARIIERTYGLEPPADLAFASPAPARFTDDTQMTLFMAEGLRRALDRGVARDRETFRQEMARSLVHWLATQNKRVYEELEDRESDLLEAMVSLGEGWVGEEALAIALAVAMCADVESEEGIRQALWLSVRHSGDSDSTGAMAGNLIGAMCAPEAMPTRWLAQLEMRDVVAHCLS